MTWWGWLLIGLAIAVVTLVVPVPKRWPSLVGRLAFWRREGLRRRVVSRRRLLLMYAALAVVGLVLLLVWGLPALLTQHPHLANPADRHKAISDTRTGLIAVVVAAGAGGGLAYTARTYRLSREGHITDRYSKAIEQLGHDKIEIRLGGIYALERLMRDSPADQPTIMEVLAAYVREHSPIVLVPANASKFSKISKMWRTDANNESVSEYARPTEDVVAVLTVLRRRHTVAGENPIDLKKSNLAEAELAEVNLAQADLTEALLANADLSEANLYQANFSGAILFGADLHDADLYNTFFFEALLARAGFTDANLRDADLRDADLTRADLTRADLTRADLTRADLAGARLSGADLGTTKGLTQEQINEAVLDEDTVLPPGLVSPTATPSL